MNSRPTHTPTPDTGAPIQLYNTLTRRKDTLTPLTPGKVSVYTCGLTVYSQPHIGNWVSYIYWDVLVRLLRAAGLVVTRTQNITDVGHLTSDADDGEDKMQAGAQREGLTAWDIARKYMAIAEHEAYDLLGLTRPDHLVRATDYIPQQIAFARALEEKGYTYRIPGDGLYFDTSKLAHYGQLARLDIAGLAAGARVSAAGKHNATDFAIWKLSPPGSTRDMEWESPWGVGFPGWHLECSVIARETLGDQIDIHTGGIDHIPVHHSNEIAQTESLTGKQFARIWLHNNHLKVDGRKMSKSLGNIITLADITAHGAHPMAFKLAILSKHYRTEGNFTWEILDAASHRYQRWQEAASLRWQATAVDSTGQTNTLLASAPGTLHSKLSDDLGTPEAVAFIDSVCKAILSTPPQQLHQPLLAAFTAAVDDLLGLSLDRSTPNLSAQQQQLLSQRSQARAAKDWQASDTLRDELSAQGITVNDSPHGTTWHYIVPK